MPQTVSPGAAGKEKARCCRHRALHQSARARSPSEDAASLRPGDPQSALSASRSSGFRSWLPARPSHPSQRTVARIGPSLPVTAAGPQRILTVFPGPSSGPISPTN